MCGGRLSVLARLAPFDFKTRTGVLRESSCGKDEDDRQSDKSQECAAMSIAAIGSTQERPMVAVRRIPLRSVGELNVELLTANPLLQTDRKSEIRFSPGGTVTIVLGMRAYGRGWYSAHFASLVANRFGLPLRRIRVYYSATLPAVLQTPQEFKILPEGSRLGPLATAAGELIEKMCERIVENGRVIFAELTGATPDAVGFHQAAGRFFVLDGGRSATIWDIAKIANEKRLSADVRTKEMGLRRRTFDDQS
jgi:CO/xanthine dehydrogenase Mo-binding subunit